MTKWICLLAILSWASMQRISGQTLSLANEEATVSSADKIDLNGPGARAQIWKDDIGSGMVQWSKEFDVSAGAGYGLRICDGLRHDIALASVRYGCVVSDVLGDGHWYGGNIELLGEGFAGSQFYPRVAYVAGVAPVFRYVWETHCRFAPFIDLSPGLAATDIGRPSLGGIFEFSLQGGVGLQYFVSEYTAVLLQYRYLHLSSAGLEHPNEGVNAGMIFVGFGWHF